MNNLKAEQLAGTTDVAGTSGPSLAQSPPDEPDRTIELSFYFLPDSLYRVIPNDLLFDKGTMGRLLRAGEKGAFSTPATVKADEERLKLRDPKGYDSQKPVSIAPQQKTPEQQQAVSVQEKTEAEPRKPLNYKVSTKQLKKVLEKLEK